MDERPTDERRSDQELIGRADLDDVEAILAITNTDDDAEFHDVGATIDTRFTWDYERARPRLGKLYEKAKLTQWNANDLPWQTDVDQEEVVRANAAMSAASGLAPMMDLSDTPFAAWGDKEWLEFGVESQNWTLSQFLHGEQGALVCTARIVETVPWIDAKYYAATQVMDEARHVEVFSRYLDEKLTGHYPINAHLQMLLDDIIADSRWDMTYLGMQIMVEGLALAAFGFITQMTTEPLLKQLLRNVMADEARHVAFGVFLGRANVEHHDVLPIAAIEHALELGRCDERDPVLEEALVEATHRDRRVLPHPGKVDELQVDEFDVVVFRELNDFLGIHFQDPPDHAT